MTFFGGFTHRHHTEAVHHGFQRAQRIDFGDDDVGAHTFGAHGNALAAPTVAADDKVLAGQQHIGGADNAINGALPGAIAVVEEVLSLRIVDRHYREFQLALRGHRAQPDYTRRRLFGAADHIGEQFAATGVQHGNQVHAVVHGNVRTHIEYTVHVRVVLLVAFTFDRIDRHFVV